MFEQLNTLQVSQNGWFALFKTCAGGKRAPLQNRFERYLLLGATEKTIENLRQMSLVG